MWVGTGALPKPVSSFNWASSCQFDIRVPETKFVVFVPALALQVLL
jgi:hypothetical protein